MPDRLVWNLLLLFGGCLYVTLALNNYVMSPVFAIAFVGLAAQEMVHDHRRKR
ncbi:MAG TPA: hypothetical protein VHW24_23800 [Bryobacteraceae bacterium]|jgi:hypothetical protein|nr:hypothetical protein [Bryobacteraceae bacterium]